MRMISIAHHAACCPIAAPVSIPMFVGDGAKGGGCYHTSGTHNNREGDVTGLRRFGEKNNEGEVRTHHPLGKFPFCHYGLIFGINVIR